MGFARVMKDGGDVGRGEVACVHRLARALRRTAADGGHANGEQAEPADKWKPRAWPVRKHRHGREAERGDEAEDRIARSGTEAGDEAGEAAIENTAADAEQADRADRRGHGETNGKTFYNIAPCVEARG